MLFYIDQRQKNVEKEMEGTFEGIKFSYLRLGNAHYVPSVKITFLVVSP